MTIISLEEYLVRPFNRLLGACRRGKEREREREREYGEETVFASTRLSATTESDEGMNDQSDHVVLFVSFAPFLTPALLTLCRARERRLRRLQAGIEGEDG